MLLNQVTAIVLSQKKQYPFHLPEHWGLVQNLLMLLMHMESRSSKKSDAGKDGSGDLSLTVCNAHERGGKSTRETLYLL